MMGRDFIGGGTLYMKDNNGKTMHTCEVKDFSVKINKPSLEKFIQCGVSFTRCNDLLRKRSDVATLAMLEFGSSLSKFTQLGMSATRAVMALRALNKAMRKPCNITQKKRGRFGIRR